MGYGVVCYGAIYCCYQFPYLVFTYQSSAIDQSNPRTPNAWRSYSQWLTGGRAVTYSVQTSAHIPRLVLMLQGHSQIWHLDLCWLYILQTVPSSFRSNVFIIFCHKIHFLLDHYGVSWRTANRRPRLPRSFTTPMHLEILQKSGKIQSRWMRLWRHAGEEVHFNYT